MFAAREFVSLLAASGIVQPRAQQTHPQRHEDQEKGELEQFVQRLLKSPTELKAGGYAIMTKNNYGLTVWMDEKFQYLGISIFIPSDESPHVLEATRKCS